MHQDSSVRHSLKIETSILQGEAAITVLEEAAFKSQWKKLVMHSGLGSVFQAPNFVLPWYKENIRDFFPVVVTAYAGYRLVGLLTLARKIHHKQGTLEKRLVGAGNYYALYQSWLVEKPFSQEFWNKGIKRLLHEIPGCVINLKSIHHQGIIQDLTQLSDFRKHTVVEKFLNPVLDFREEDYDRIFAKRHFKSKINRLNRAGNVVFEKITSQQRLAEVFPTVAKFYALRQGAAFNKIPFENNDQALSMFAAWLSDGVLHMTCLWLDGSLMGSIIMVNDFGKTGHLAGLIAYSPSHAKFSPGLVQLYQHAMLLKEENFQNMKLSPGYDAYKDRFSNKNEEIYELMISNSKFQLIKRRLRIRLRNILLSRGIRPMELEVEWSKWRSKMRNLPRKWLRKINPRSITVVELLQRMEYFKNSSNVNEVYFGRNELDQLLLVDDQTFELARWEFLDDALKRLEENQHFFAFKQDNRLLGCVWYTGELVSSPKDLVEKQKHVSKVFLT
ncbi:GNAT family N-acetyltransferase [Mariniradius sediminis]|uniref:GNAT family N-acetyltransferase n=1 Tax=Mariniradius sediminis TaxID=2909237 RepID=A0ABS9BQP3_9BACT|nr:GNAT family N-acetyltransferase [Mariniradius sediminis]MCF1750119.1 GNAT family N-acetyltransferase [Mariniradius sediminis]